MAEQNNQALQNAEQFLREGRKQEARLTLVEYVRGNPSSTRGWWMLSFVLTDPRQQIECVEHVLRLDSNYAPARSRLEKLKGNLHAPPAVSPFVVSTPSQPVATPIQPSIQSPASRPRKKTNNMLLQFAVLGGMACVALGIFGFAAVMVVRGGSNVSMQSAQSVPPVQPTAVTPMSLPPTWTPPPPATLIATYTLIPTNTPIGVIPDLATPTVFVLPTVAMPKPPVGVVEGASAPDFKLTNVNTDKKVRLSDYQGKVVIVFFWATWCQYCKMEMPEMEKVYRAYKDQGLVVLAVDVGETAGKARKYRDANSLTFPILNDSESEVSSKYRVTGLPTQFFVNPSGVISSVNVGTMDYSSLNLMVRRILPQ
ncbi:MAG: TlpA family protein disulfide reductase [Chloroflexi bacterium]|nr:TlpA family protein disulfide reductase [Chloroflexota bacterium]